MAKNDQSVNSEELLALLERASVLFTSERTVSEKIDKHISKFENGIPFFLEDVLPTVQAMESCYRENLGQLSKQRIAHEMSQMITEFLELFDLGWLIRDKND